MDTITKTASFKDVYRTIVPNPLLHSLVLGGGAYYLTKLLSPAINGISRSLQLPFSKHLDESNTKLPWAAGIATTLIALAMQSSTAQKGYGLLQWNAPLDFDTEGPEVDLKGKYTYKPEHFRKNPSMLPVFEHRKWDSKEDVALPPPDYKFDKSASLMTPQFGYQFSDINMSSRINASNAIDTFQSDPFLRQHNPYAMNMGTSIVANAANTAGTNVPTLGNIFDSAVNKIENKLTFQGVAGVAAKTALANVTARLFTGAVDTIMGLAPDTKDKLISAGTWAGAINAILS